ncbi:WD40 repeat-like protein, partial [Stereum hirsutum FP-91666 SS1]
KVFRGHTDDGLSLAFSHNGKLLASGSRDCTLRVWNVETGETVLGPLKGHTDLVGAVAFSPDDRRIVSGSDDRTIRIWDVQTGKQLLEFEEDTSWIYSVVLSSDGSRVAFTDASCDILIWDVDSKCRIRLLEKQNILFSAFTSPPMIDSSQQPAMVTSGFGM